MKKLFAAILLLGAIGGFAYLYWRAGIVEMIQGKTALDLGAPFTRLGADYPWAPIILMAAIGAFLYSFRWWFARKPPQIPLRKGADPKGKRKAVPPSPPPPRIPGALMMNSYFIISTIVVLTVGAVWGKEEVILGRISFVLGVQVLLGFFLMLLAWVWEKSLYRFGSLVGILVHFGTAGAIAFSVIRGLDVLR